ncbi:MAG: hypothetical protein DHS20C19_06660 [Acidimicrobiales bacterium]|nr:MAG: hypothetical protein DHS20C19_06660 [Acidimicrobiales bacterium]
MNTTRSLTRWLAILAAVVLLAAACGDDGGSNPAAPGGNVGGDDSSGDDSSGDDGSADDSSAGDDGSGGIATLGDCEDFAAAIDGLDSFADAGDPTSGTSPADIQADFARAQAQLAALQNQLPSDLQGDAQTIANGLAALEEAFAAIGYDATSIASPEDALAFASAMSSADVMAMAGASINIQQWVTAGCNG